MAQPSAASPAQQTQPKPAHRHTNPDTVYQNSCPACRAADAARSKLDVRAIAEEDLARTTFLIPDSPFDADVCRAYIAHKYPNAMYIGSTLDISRVAHWPDGEQIVIVRRDTWPKNPTPSQKKVKDLDEGVVFYEPVDPTTLMHEIVESAPLDIRELCVITKADRFSKATSDDAPLKRRMAELMPLPYRIDLPRHEDDVLVRFIHA